MSMKDKILMRKITKREKHKLKLQLEFKEKKGNFTNVLETNEEDEVAPEIKNDIECFPESEQVTEDAESEEEWFVEIPKKSSKKKTKNEPTGKVSTKLESNALTDVTFESMRGKISDNTLKAISDMGFTKMTEVQAKCIPPLLEKSIPNLIASGKTGSGKTLAFLIPVVEIIAKFKFKPRNGTGAIILCPTRELCMQTFGVLEQLMKYHQNTIGMIIGGSSVKDESRKLNNGINILVATPGRLWHHMENTPDFFLLLNWFLVIDEADRMLDIGFGVIVKQIVSRLPQYRQTSLISATQTLKVKELAQFIFKDKEEEPLFINLDDKHTNLEQSFMIVPTEDRLTHLYGLIRIKIKAKEKVMVFFNSCSSVEYHHKLFNYIELPVMCMHGQQKQSLRTSTFFQFSNVESGVLLCTDIAARGLDIPAVDLIIQYDPPSDPIEYLQRAGRTSRGEGRKGRNILMLRPEEYPFLYYLKRDNIPLSEANLNTQVTHLQSELQNIIGQSFFLKRKAGEAYHAFLKSYDSLRLKTVFNMDNLNLVKVANSFGLIKPPPDNTHVTRKQFHSNKRKMK